MRPRSCAPEWSLFDRGTVFVSIVISQRVTKLDSSTLVSLNFREVESYVSVAFLEEANAISNYDREN